MYDLVIRGAMVVDGLGHDPVRVRHLGDGVKLNVTALMTVAQVAEVSRRPDGLPKVERVVCATCGRLLEERPLRRTAA